MKKTLTMLLGGLLFALAGNAQVSNADLTPFYKGKLYANAGFSGLDLNYNSNSKWSLSVNAKVGYLFADNWMVLADGMWNVRQKADNDFRLGAGVRYCIEQNGLYIGAGARYKHEHAYDDFMPNVNLGYTFFLSRTVTIEPELYYDFSTKDLKDYSDFGFRIGFGIYLDKLF